MVGWCDELEARARACQPHAVRLPPQEMEYDEKVRAAEARAAAQLAALDTQYQVGGGGCGGAGLGPPPRLLACPPGHAAKDGKGQGMGCLQGWRRRAWCEALRFNSVCLSELFASGFLATPAPRALPLSRLPPAPTPN